MTSAPLFDNDLCKWIRKTYPDPNIQILDMGCGVGKYGMMLRKYYPNIDGLDIWPDHLSKIKDLYRNVFIQDINDFMYHTHYDIVIFGDVIEHMHIPHAQKAIKTACANSEEVIISVPYLYGQGELYENKYEIHIQADLHPWNISTRYPEMNLLLSSFDEANYKFRGIGVFTKTKPKNEDIINKTKLII